MNVRLRLETEIRAALRKFGLMSMVRRFQRGSNSGVYEDRFRSALAEGIREGDTVWDVGANVGVYTGVFAEWVGPSGSVVAFEPAPAAFDTLVRHVKNASNVRCLQIALGDRVDEVAIAVGDDPTSPTNSLVRTPLTDTTAAQVTVKVMPGDSVRIDGTIPTPQVIKLDVEGYEVEALRGLDATLRDPRCRAIYCEVHFAVLASRGCKHAPAEMEKTLVDRGFAVTWIDRSHLGALRVV